MGLLLGGGAAGGADPASTCKADKLVAAGVFDLCLLKANARAVKSGSTPDFTKCDAAFTATWTRTESRGGSACPTNGDAVPIASQVIGDVAGIVAALTPTTSTTSTTGP